MPSLTGAWTEVDGAIVDVEIGHSRQQVRQLRAAGRPIPQPVGLTALIDSGAEMSCIDPAALARLTLPCTGFKLVNMPAASNLGFAAQHAASLTVVHPSGNRRDDFRVTDLPLTEVPLGPLGYEVLIGRDVLTLCTLALDGPALRFTLTY